MARIPTGSFGLVAPQAAPGADTSAVGEAVQNLGQGVARLGLIVQEKRQQAARAESANAYLDHQIGVKTAAEEVADDLATGKVTPDDAQAEFQTRVNKLPRAEIAHLPAIDQQNLERGRKRNAFEGATIVDRQAEATRRALFKDQFNAGLDKLGKLAGMPNADIEGINGQAALFREVGINAGVAPDDVDRAIQGFKDQNWLNHATQRAMESADSLGALKELKHDLTAKDGYYADRLDTNKRNGVLRAVLSDMQQLQNRISHEVDRREARAAVAMNTISRQISSGVPATADMWAEWSTVIKGTSFAPEFKSMVDAEDEVQEVLRMPIEQQVKFAADKEAELLTTGGSLQEAANVQRLQTAVKENVNLMQQAPLQFLANRTGEDVQPLDIASIGNPDSTEVAKQLQERTIAIKAMRTQYGDQVPMRPLLPQEAAVLAASLNNSGARQSAMLFGVLRNAVGDDDAYAGIMQQIAPDAPVKAFAGLLSSRQRAVTLERNWVSNDVIASSPDVAATMLKGLEILQPTKDAKGQDGAPKVGLYLPPQASSDLQSKFTQAVGDAFAGRPEAAEDAFQAVKAYYVGKAAQTGRLAEGASDADTDIAREAVTATIGEVVDFNGNGEVLAPWGMDIDEFESRIEVAFVAEAKRRGLPAVAPMQYSALGLKSAGDGSYYVTSGRNYILDGEGEPLVLNVK